MKNNNIIEDNIVKCEIVLDRVFYPKNAREIKSGEYGIFTGEITKRIENCDENMYNIKLKGNCPKIEFGNTYKVFCKLAETHDIYGDTYEIVYISRCIDISSKDKQREFLRSVLNERLVDRLFEKYDDVIKLLEEKDIKSLIKVKGIGNQVALRLIDEYEESKDYSSIYLEFGKLGLTSTLIKKLVDFYVSPDVVVDVMKNNPYDLVRVDGIGFKRADEIACRAGMGEHDPRRIKGFMMYYLNKEGEVGKSYLYYQDLMNALYDTLGFVPKEIVNQTAKDMIDNEDVIVLDNGNKVALKKYYNLEKKIMEELIRLQIGRVEVVESGSVDDDELNKDYIPKSFTLSNWEEIVSNVEDIQGFKFTNEQKDAIKLSLDNNVIALTGLGGTGKSATANGMCALYEGGNITCVALSGKAAVRITEATGLPASTIHRALGYQNGEFVYSRYNKLPTDVVLIDEATMINGTLFLALLESIPSGARLIIMGDPNQLTSIGNCQVFTDILNSEVLPMVKLTNIHRQARKSAIISTGINIASQKQIFKYNYVGNDILGELQDLELDISNTAGTLSDNIVNHFQKQYDKVKDVMKIQVIVAMRLRGDLSCYNLNTKLQNIYNPKFTEDNEIEIFLGKQKDEVKKYTIRKGDKVLNTKNNYKCINTDGDITPVFNGNIGIVKDIDENGYCTIDFEGIGEVLFNKNESKKLELAYACTTHKYQGSQSDVVIIGIDNSSYIMNTSELLYTMVSRAKKYSILVGVNTAISHCINTKELKTKQTFLKDMLLENSHRITTNE